MTRSGTSGTLWMPSQFVTVLKSLGPVIRSHVVSFFGSEDIDKMVLPLDTVRWEGMVVLIVVGGANAVTELAWLPTKDRRIVTKNHWIIMIAVFLKARRFSRFVIVDFHNNRNPRET